MTKNIHQQVTFRATPPQVFAALMDEQQHATFTDSHAKIDARVGGAFTCYDDYIHGFTLELVPAKLIVQAWHSQNWPAGVYTIVTFKLAKAAGGKTKLTFSQIGVPADDWAEKSRGWKTHYWEPLKRYLQQP
jgi:uncharacterized protein YndB with AHSA1/START domain